MIKPTWHEVDNSESRIICDATVLRDDGKTQIISECDFDYSFYDKEKELITKNGDSVSEFFFVEEVLSAGNFRKAEASNNGPVR